MPKVGAEQIEDGYIDTLFVLVPSGFDNHARSRRGCYAVVLLKI
jgi:hypothetical protein